MKNFLYTKHDRDSWKQYTVKSFISDIDSYKHIELYFKK